MAIDHFAVDQLGKKITTSTGQLVTVARAAGTQAIRQAETLLNSSQISTDAVLSSVEGAVSELKGAVDSFGAFSGGRGGAETRAVDDFSELNAKGGMKGPPWENELEKFISYSTIFTLSCLTTEEINLPDFSYRKNPPTHVILRSGGTGSDKVKTLQESNSGTVEYYIDDVEMKSLITHSRITKQSRAMRIGFKVFEPYSMGMFNETLQVAAVAAGHKNYLKAPFLLSMKFIGWDDDGRPQVAKQSERHFPIRLMSSKFSVTDQGSTYDVIATPYNHIALADKTQQVKTDVSLKGKTVQELLQTGADSLATILNTRLLKKEEAKQVPKADKYVIMFPTKTSSLAESMLQDATESSAGATISPSEGTVKELGEERKQELFESIGGLLNSQVPADFQATLDRLLGVTITRSEIGEAIRTFAEKQENVNPIGLSRIVKEKNETGNVPFTPPNAAKIDNQKPQPPGAPGFTPVCRSKCQISPDIRTFQFPPGRKIQDIIEEVILNSEWGRDLRKRADQPDKFNMMDHFKIDTQVYNIADSKTVDATGDSPKVFVYRILPFKVSVSKLASPSKPQPDQEAIRKEAGKEYNYIYTGENKDVLDFDIQYNAAYFLALGSDFGQNTSAEKQGGKMQMKKGSESEVAKQNEGDNNTISKSGSISTGERISTSTGHSGGGGKEHPETQIARDYNDVLVDSDADLLKVDLKIWGDPYYLADSGMGNYIAEPTAYLNMTKDGTMNYENSEVDVILNFRTPFDYKGDGMMEFPEIGAQPVKAFSGLYKIMYVISTWSGGQFVQSLRMARQRNQEADMKAKGTKSGNTAITQGTKENKIETDPFADLML